MTLLEVPAAWPHEQGRGLVVQPVALVRRLQLDRAFDRLGQVRLALEQVGPGGRVRVLEVGHEHARARVEGVDHHLPVGRAGDLHPAVTERLRHGLDRPVALANLPRLGQEVWQLARAQPFLPLGARREQLAPPRPEAPLELLDERHRFRSQHFLQGISLSRLAPRPPQQRRPTGVRLVLPGRGGLHRDRRRRARLPALLLGWRRLPARRRLARARSGQAAAVSWAAHDLEPYAIQRHLKLKIAFVPLLFGSYSPDMLTKWFVYGIHLGPWELKASDPAQFHRGWPVFGFTHSLLFGAVLGLLIWKGFGSKLWGLSFMIGQWAHALTDTCDTLGTQLLFPWTFHFHIDAWAYAGQTGRLTDAAAYFSGLGGMWDVVWIVYGLISWRVLTSAYFDSVIYRADAFWPWVNRWVPRGALIVLYRAAFFYGTSRWIAWTIWAHVIHHYPYDLSWGGPHWVPAAHP